MQLLHRKKIINNMGSIAFVTDNNATVTQGFLYAPFGEITTEYNATFANGIIPKYTFNAKELDEETGMYYYEARYYKPPVFTSRDPHFERYFWTSPYGYCNNNPLKYVDPTGMDEWEVDLVNKTVSVVAGTEGTQDKFTVLDKDGNRVSSNTYEHGTIQKVDSRSAASFAISGDAAGTDLFEFLADNTGVEWEQFATGENGSGTNYLFTSFDYGKVEGSTFSVMNRQKIRKYIHNHTNGTTEPTGFQYDKGVMYQCATYNYFLEGKRAPMYNGDWAYTDEHVPYCSIYANGKYHAYDPQSVNILKGLSLKKITLPK